jgi:predicted ArsR family transcriptional regulator
MLGQAGTTQRQEVLAAIDAAGNYGCTAYELADWLGIQQNVAARRCTDLERLGLIRTNGETRPGSSSRKLLVWVARQQREYSVPCRGLHAHGQRVLTLHPDALCPTCIDRRDADR